jgi:predicted nucleotidyltransferase
MGCQNTTNMTLQNLRQAGRERILTTAARYGARNVRVFGSVARGDADDLSDLDILVDLDSGRTLMDLGGLLMDLRAQLGMRVDVTTEGMLRPDIRARGLSEAMPL